MCYCVGEELQEIVGCNQVRVRGTEAVPQGRGYLTSVYYTGLHLGVQFIKNRAE